MPHVAINPPDVFDVRPFGFSQAVLAADAQRLQVSGQVGVDQHGRTVSTTLGGQLEQCVENLRAVLSAAGAGLADVTMLRIYLTESTASDLTPVREVLRTRFVDAPPAATWLIVSGLARDEWLVELEAEAVLPVRSQP